jgi:hypothetical protein
VIYLDDGLLSHEIVFPPLRILNQGIMFLVIELPHEIFKNDTMQAFFLELKLLSWHTHLHLSSLRKIFATLVMQELVLDWYFF